MSAAPNLPLATSTSLEWTAWADVIGAAYKAAPDLFPERRIVGKGHFVVRKSDARAWLAKHGVPEKDWPPQLRERESTWRDEL